jgi:hypothetical protein
MMRIPKFLEKTGTLSGLVGYFLGWGIGGATVAWFEKKYLEAKYEEALRKEIEATKEFYRILHKKDMTPSDLVESTEKVIDEDVEEPLEDDSPQTTEAAVTIIKEYFPEAETIATLVDTDEPRAVDANELSATDLSEIHILTFYREDGTLVSEDGLPIYHPEDQIGLNNFRGLDGIPEGIVQVCFLDDENSVGYMVDIDDGAFEGQALKHQHVRHRGSTSVRKFRSSDDDWDA